MSFPATILPLVSEMFYSSDWQNITSYVRRDGGQGVSLSGRGRRDEASKPTPTQADFIVSNDDDTFSFRKPTAANFRLLGQNTPTRHRVRWLNDQFDRSVSSGVGTSTDGTVTWGTSGGVASNYNVTGGQLVLTMSTAAVSRVVGCTPAIPIHDVSTIVDTSASPATGASITARLAFSTSTTSTNNSYLLWVIFQTDGRVTIKISKLVAGVQTDLTSTTDVGAYTSGETYRVRFKRYPGGYFAAQVISSAEGSINPGWTTWTETPDTSHTAASLDKLMLIGRAESGNTNVSPTVVFEYAELNSYRFWGEAPTWDPDADTSGQDRYVRIQAYDAMRRLSKGARVLKSPMFRTLTGQLDDGFSLIHYVPMEDQSGATQLASSSGVKPGGFSGGVTLASNSSAAGSQPLPVLSQYARIFGGLPLSSVDGGWMGYFTLKYDTKPASNRTLAYISVPGAGSSVVRVNVVLDVSVVGSTGFILRAVDSTGATVSEAASGYSALASTSAWTVDSEMYGRNLSIVFAMFNTSGNPNDYDLFIQVANPDGTFDATATTTASITGAMVQPTSYVFGHNTAETWSIGHLAFIQIASAYDFSGSAEFLAQANKITQTLSGYAGERAGRRLLRLGAEENMLVHVIGDPDDTQPCGPQRVDTFLNNCQAAADADQGMLYGSRDFLGLEFRTNHSMLRQAGLDLSYSGDQLYRFGVAETDRWRANKVTARRDDGSSATVEVTDGYTSTDEPPNGIGEYEESQTWNVHTDGQLAPLAGWRAHVGSWDELRVKTAEVLGQRLEIYQSPTTLAQLMMLDPGDYLGVSSPRSDLPPDTLRSILQGWNETLANFEWKWTPTLTSAGPYDVMQLDSTTYGRLAGDHLLHEAVDTTATAWKIRTGTGPHMIADDSADGWQWMVDGELVTVTDVAPPTIALRGTGTASSGSSGSRTPGAPAGWQANDLVLIAAATRNSGTGIPDTPTNWVRLPFFESDANVQVFGRIYDGFWTMPTVTFTGGAANEDTIAHSAAFSGNFHNASGALWRAAPALNASQQDILYPALPRVDLPYDFMGLYVGWKQDDWTSVATPTSWTVLTSTSSAAGNDAALTWGYRIFTSYPAVGALSPTAAVTGGAAAISRGAVGVIRSTYQNATVTRSANGVVRSHIAGADLFLHPNAHLGY